MAQYRLSAQVITRADGSAPSFAAYRAGVALADEATGEVHDYSRRRGVVEAEILAPPGAPGWATDRARLWNEVERAEKRDDAQLAREIQLSLPSELTAEQRHELLREFVRREFVALGMVADVAIHAPERVTHKMLEHKPDQYFVVRDDGSMDNGNWHAHILLTLREIGPGGFGKKNRTWNDRKLLNHWREAWADAQNAALAKHGHAVRVDHRSHAERGIEDEPQIHMGRAATAMERRGEASDRGDINREIRARNAERAAERDRIADLERQIMEARAEAVQLVGGTLGVVVEAAKAAAAVQPRPGAADQAAEEEPMSEEAEAERRPGPGPGEIARGRAADPYDRPEPRRPAQDEQDEQERQAAAKAAREREREQERAAEIDRRRERAGAEAEKVARMQQRIAEAEQKASAAPAPSGKAERMARDLAAAQRDLAAARGGGLLARMARAIFGPGQGERAAADLVQRIERAIERERPQQEAAQEAHAQAAERARAEADALRQRLPGAQRLALRADLDLAVAEAARGPGPGESEQERAERLLRPWVLREHLAGDDDDEARRRREAAERLVAQGVAPTTTAVERERLREDAQEAAQERARATQRHEVDEGQGYGGPR